MGECVSIVPRRNNEQVATMIINKESSIVFPVSVVCSIEAWRQKRYRRYGCGEVPSDETLAVKVGTASHAQLFMLLLWQLPHFGGVSAWNGVVFGGHDFPLMGEEKSNDELQVNSAVLHPIERSSVLPKLIFETRLVKDRTVSILDASWTSVRQVKVD